MPHGQGTLHGAKCSATAAPWASHPRKLRIDRQDTEESCPSEWEPQRPGSGHSSRPHCHSTVVVHTSDTRVLYTCQLFLLIPVVLTFGTCDL